MKISSRNPFSTFSLFEWVIFVFLLLGLAYAMIFKFNIFNNSESQLHPIARYTPLKENQSEMILQFYSSDGRSALYERPKDPLHIGKNKPTKVFYEYKDNLLLRGYIFFENIADFNKAKDALDSSYGLRQLVSYPTHPTLRETWKNDTTSIVVDEISDEEFFFPKGYYFVFQPIFQKFPPPKSLLEKKDFPKMTLFINPPENTKESRALLKSAWINMQKKFHAPGIERILDANLISEFDKSFKDDPQQFKLTNFLEVSKSLGAKYAVYGDLYVLRTNQSQTTSEKKYWIVIQLSIYDIEANKKIYFKEQNYTDIDQSNLNQYLIKSVEALNQLIQEAPSFSK